MIFDKCYDNNCRTNCNDFRQVKHNMKFHFFIPFKIIYSFYELTYSQKE